MKERKKVKRFTGVLEGVEVEEVVGLFAELDASVATSELLDEETVVLLHHLPYQLPWNRRHCYLLPFTFTCTIFFETNRIH